LKGKADPFTLEIIKGSLLAIGDEMFVALQRTSKSPIIYEVLDYAVGLTDAQGQLITQGNGVTSFLGTLNAAVREVLEKYRDNIKPGDLFMTNDPYGGGGTHLSDVTLSLPVFYDNHLIGFVVNKAHWTEVGGKDPGSWTTDATEIYQEGLQFPCIKLFEQGTPNRSLLDLIEANVRLPDMTLGDLWASVAALKLGERHLLALCRAHGREAVLSATERLLAESGQLVRRELQKLPKGVFEAEDFLDDDGLGHGPFPVRVKVTITDEEFICDFTGSHPQVPGPINCSYTGLCSGMRAIFKAVTGPHIPVNEGAFRPLKVICPPGTVFSAERPAPVSANWEARLLAVDLVWKALAPHVPDRLPAGHFVSVCGTIVAGQHPDTGEPFLLVEPQAGGWGAGATKDGESGLVCVGNGETYNLAIEVAETRYGILTEQYAFSQDRAGAGRFRGGKGLIREYRILSEKAYLTVTFGRHRFPAWGMASGQQGSCNRVEIEHRDGRTVTLGKAARYRLLKGERVRLVTAIGGGYGDPHKRPHDSLLDDLRNGYISVEEAVQDYGLDPAFILPHPDEKEGDSRD
jgi:N-methylhydantoinase B